MALSSYNRKDIPFPSRIFGWLNVWDVPPCQIDDITFQAGRPPKASWDPFFCVIRQDLKTFTCHKSEEVKELPGLVELPNIRLDEGKWEFDRRWGYETLKNIKDNALQHGACADSAAVGPSSLVSSFTCM